MLLIHTYFNFFLRFMGNKLQSNIIYYHTKVKSLQCNETGTNYLLLYLNEINTGFHLNI